MKTPALLFDMDGTLIDSESVVLNAWEKAYKAVNTDKVWNFNKMLEMMGQPSPKIAEGFDIPKEKQDQFIQLFRTYIQRDKMVLFDDVKPVLKILVEYNIPMAIITGARTKSAEQLLLKNKINQHFTEIIGGDITKRGKPFPDPILLTLNKLNIKKGKERILFIGDSINDLLSAKASGIKSVLIWRKKGKIPTNLSRNADVIIHSMYELLDLLS